METQSLPTNTQESRDSEVLRHGIREHLVKLGISPHISNMAAKVDFVEQYYGDKFPVFPNKIFQTVYGKVVTREVDLIRYHKKAINICTIWEADNQQNSFVFFNGLSRENITFDQQTSTPIFHTALDHLPNPAHNNLYFMSLSDENKTISQQHNHNNINIIRVPFTGSQFGTMLTKSRIQKDNSRSPEPNQPLVRPADPESPPILKSESARYLFRMGATNYMFIQNEERKHNYDGEEMSTRQLQVLYKSTDQEAKIDTVHASAIFFKISDQESFNRFLSFITRHAIDQLSSLGKAVSFNAESPQKVVIEVFKNQLPPDIEVPSYITIKTLSFTREEANKVKGRVQQNEILQDESRISCVMRRDATHRHALAQELEQMISNPPEGDIIPNPENQDTISQTNLILNSLLHTLLDISKQANDRVGLDTDLYDLQNMEVSQNILAIYTVFKNILSGDLRLTLSNFKSITQGASPSYIFEAHKVQLDKSTFSYIEFLVRPYSHVVDGKVRAQARTSLRLISDDLPGGIVGIRIDPPDSRQDNHIVFDIQTGDSVSASENQKIEDHYFQAAAGHHFKSGITLSNKSSEQIAAIHKTILSHIS